MTTANAEAPFLDVQSFVQQEVATPPAAPARTGAWSPFLSVYESEDGENGADDSMREAYSTLVNELYDEEFDESLFELLSTARGMHQDHLATGHSLEDADRVVTQHFDQLIAEAESMLDAMAREFGSRDVGTFEAELDHFAESYVPVSSLEPEFEDFLGRLARKVGKGVRAVAKKAASIALGPVLNRLKPILKPLLHAVLNKAIGRLPVSLQPVARRLAERLGLAGRAPTPAAAQPASPATTEPPAAAGSPDAVAAAPLEPPTEDAGSPVQPAAGAEVSEIQFEFDQLIAEAMLAEDDRELELELARATAHSNGAGSPVFANLDDARERFMYELGTLKEGEDPTPHVENFLPAVLPALRIAIRLAGRPKVVNFLAGLSGRFISNLVGPEHTPALSRAMVDAGMKLMSLELEEQEGARLAASAIASTVEETLTRVASLPDDVLDNQELLEGFALEAFEQAAAANLPALFSATTYKKRPDLLEGGVNATWVMLPLRRPRYKRCSRTFNVKITPQMAEAVETFEDAPLSEYFQDQLGVSEGEDVEAEVHLYEVLPGGTAADIARNESETPGLGSSDEVALAQLHPLTYEAASVLLGKPGLGRAVGRGSNIRSLAAGQRLFHLVAGRRPLTVAGVAGRQRVRRLVRLDVVLDIPRDLIRVCVFLSEVKAQQLAVRLRQKAHTGSLAVGFHKMLGRRLRPVLQGERLRRLRLVHPAATPGAGTAALLDRGQAVVPQAYIGKLQAWLTEAFSQFAKTQADKFLAASEDPADGVTLVFTIERPPGLKAIGELLLQKGPPASTVAQSIANGATPSVRVEAVPGFKCD